MTFRVSAPTALVSVLLLGACLFDPQPRDLKKPPAIDCRTNADCPAGWQCETVGTDPGATCPEGEDCESSVHRCRAPDVVRPIAVALDVDTNEDTALVFSLAAAPIEGVKTFSVTTQPLRGTLDLTEATAGAVVYTPEANFTGRDTLNYVVTVDGIESETQSVTITVDPQNDAPTVESAEIRVPEDDAAAILLQAFDVDGDPLIWTITANALQGACDVSEAGLLLYRPSADYEGNDSCTLQVDDGTVAVSLVVGISVAAVNDAPIVQNTDLTLNEDTSDAIDLALLATDVDDGDDTLTFTLVDEADASILYQGPLALVPYQPPADFNGERRISILATDSAGASGAGVLTIHVIPVIDAPIPTPCQFDVDEDDTAGIIFHLLANSAPGEQLTYTILSTPNLGDISLFDNTLGRGTYTPFADANGEDVLDFSVSSSGFSIGTATVTFSVNSLNDAPTIRRDLALACDEDQPLHIPLDSLVADVDDELASLDLQISTGAVEGNVEVVDGIIIYTPTPNFHGNAGLSITITDIHQLSTSETLIMTVRPVADVPLLTSALILKLDEDGSEGLTLEALSPDAQPVFVIDQEPRDGVAILDSVSGKLTYTPVTNFFGTDFMLVHVEALGLNLSSTPEQVLITVNPVNDPPQALSTTLQAGEDEPTTFLYLALFSDIDDDIVDVIAAEFSGGGQSSTVTLDADGLTFQAIPDASGDGVGQLRLTVNDGVNQGHADTTFSYSVNIGAVADAPTAVSQEVTTAEDTAVVVLLKATSSDSATPTFVLTQPPAHGTVTLSTVAAEPRATYVPEQNFHGDDEFAFVALASGLTDAGTISVVVTSVNDPPLLSLPLSVNTNEDEALSLDLEGLVSDADNDPLSVVATATSGAVTITAQGLLYTPAPNFNGPVVVSLTATDAPPPALGVTASMTIDVLAVDDTPVVQGTALVAVEDTELSTVITAVSPDGTVVFSVETSTLHGTATINPNSGLLTYTPLLNFNGSDRVVVSAALGGLVSVPTFIPITVSAVDDDPVVRGDPINMVQNQTFQIRLASLVSDVDAPLGETTATFNGGTATVFLALSEDPGLGDGGDVPTNSEALGKAPTGTTFNAAIVSESSIPQLMVRIVPTPELNSATLVGGKLTLVTTSGAVTRTFNYPVVIAGILNESATTTEDEAKSVTLRHAFFDQTTPSLSIFTPPRHGTASITDGIAKYTPALNFSGTDSFVVQTAAVGFVVRSTITVVVTAVNDLPVALATTVIVDEDTPKTFQVTALDPDNNLTFLFTRVNAQAEADRPGNLSVISSGSNTKTLRYTPLSNRNGIDLVQMTVSDGVAQSTAFIVVAITPSPDQPQAQPLLVQGVEDQPTILFLGEGATDPDGDPLTFSITSLDAGSISSLNASQGVGIFVPDLNATTEVHFSYTATDPSGFSVTSQGTIAITPVNDAPIVLAPTIDLFLGAIDSSDPLAFVVTDQLNATAQPDKVVVIDVDSLASAIRFSEAGNGDLFGGVTSDGRYLPPRFIQAFRDDVDVRVSDGVATSAPVRIPVRFLDQRSCATILNTQPRKAADEPLPDALYDLRTFGTLSSDGSVIPFRGDAQLGGDEEFDSLPGWSGQGLCRMQEEGLRGYTRLAGGLSAVFGFTAPEWESLGEGFGSQGPFDLSWGRQRTNDLLIEDADSLGPVITDPAPVDNPKTGALVPILVEGPRRAELNLAPVSGTPTLIPHRLTELIRLPEDIPTEASVPSFASAEPSDWLGLVASKEIQERGSNDCLVSGLGLRATTVRARMGIFLHKFVTVLDSNAQVVSASCAVEPFAFIGIGSNFPLPPGEAPDSVQGSVGPLNAAGQLEDNGVIENILHVDLWGRDRDFRLQGTRASCAVHQANGARLSGVYLVVGSSGQATTTTCTLLD